MEMTEIGQLEGEVSRGDLIPVGLECGREDIDAIVGQDARQIRQQAAAIERTYLDLNAERSPESLLVRCDTLDVCVTSAHTRAGRKPSS